MFCFGEYLMYKGSNTYHINSVEPIEVFYNLRIDLDKLEYAVHINKIVQDVTWKSKLLSNIAIITKHTIYNIWNRKKLRLSIKHFQITSIMYFRIHTQNTWMYKLQRKRKFRKL